MDGEKISGAIDTFALGVELASLTELGKHKLSQGVHRLELKLVGASQKARPFKQEGRFLLGVDYLHLKNLKPKAAGNMPGIELVHVDYAELHQVLIKFFSCHIILLILLSTNQE